MDTLIINNECKRFKNLNTRMFLNKLALIASDSIAFFFMVIVSLVLIKPETVSNSFNRFVIIGVILLIVLFSFWGRFRHYSHRKPFWNELKDTYYVIFLASLIDYTICSIANINIDFQQWVVVWGSGFLLIPLFRYCTKILLNYFSVWSIPSFIVGSKNNAIEALKAIRSEKLMGFEIEGFIALSDDSPNNINGINVYFYNENNIRLFSNYKVFLALEYDERELRDSIIRKLTSLGIRNISVIPSTRGVPLYGTDISHFFSHEVMMLRINNNLVRKSSRFIKRGFDIIVSFLLLTLLSPLFVYIAYQVKKDGGAATYGHERVGQHGKKFKCLKFRSMVINSQEILQNLLENDALAKEEWEKDFKLKNDPRITSIGKFLRKSSLDELPQLWNVLKGEMSLVGPRPVIEDELLRYKDDTDYYLMAKPGMSGLWQVSGRNDIDYETRVYLDSWYVKNWSLWYDIAILFKTVSVVLNRNGAY
ncbi:TPA: undecaprenyl-phosphate galactose phosphotransferase WbaP [Photobacterium damselae]